MTQTDLFNKGEGDAFYERNKNKPRHPDPVLAVMAHIKLKPKYVVEFGCGNGWRLEQINETYKPKWCVGYEPSERAVTERVIPTVFKSDALLALFKIRNDYYDTVIFGFCLYLIDRESLMLIAAHTDRILKDGGHIVIHDFMPEYPYRRPYEHKEGVWSYKMDHSKLWLCHPGYKLIFSKGKGDDDGRTGVTVLQKNYTDAFPVRET